MMTEKEKMLAHVLYDANFDTELAVEREKCKKICSEYNRMEYGDFDGKNALLSALLGHVGTSVRIEPPFWCDYGYNISLGENFYANHGLVVLDAGGVTFGDNVFIGPNCGFHTSGHPVDAERRNAGLEYAHPIEVGDNVWFGAGVQVMPGVSIGSNCVIGAGSVVTKSIPDGCIAVGNPCRVLRKITEEDKKREHAWCGF